MSIKKRWTSWIGILTIVGLIAVACSTAEPEVVEKVVTQVVKETVVVEGTPQIVEKEVTVVVTAESEETAASESEEDSRYGGTLRFGMLSDPQNWTPYNVIDCQNEVVMAQIWSSLLRYNGDSELVGDLAESWEWVDDVTVVFHLRENVTWHNGDPFVADDVIQSMELRMDPEVSIDAAELEGSVASWEALDEHTVQLTLVQPNVSILRKLTSVPGHGFILHPDWDEATSGQSAETSVGTGPFMYASYEPGVAVELVRNPNYFIEGLPYLDGIEFAIVADDEARITGLRAGDLDVIEYVDFQSLPMLREDPNILVPDALGFYGARMALGMNLAPTDDVRVRHAMNYAVDREMIVDAVLAGEGEPIWGSIIPPGAFGYAPELADYYSYDPAKAAELLEEAGWTDTDGDGIRDRDGQPMIVTYVTYGPSWWSQAGEVIKANLLDVGIECELEVLPWRTVL
ncbi:MAG: ABC transporter substrate-binding protein [Chloroflexota bacterium]